MFNLLDHIKNQFKTAGGEVICVGSSSKDVFFPVGGGVIMDTPEDLVSPKKIAFELGAKYQVENRFEAPGGCAVNVSHGLARLGIKSRCYTRVGDDEIGNWILSELKKEGVGLDFIQVGEKCRSDLSVIIIDNPSGERTIFFNRDANENLKILPENFKGAEWIFASALSGNKEESWQSHLKKIIGAAEKENAGLILNPGQSNIKEDPAFILEAVKKCRILIANKDESLEIVSHIGENIAEENLVDEIFLIKKLKSLGPDVIVMTDGRKGAWACDKRNIVFAAATEDDPLDTTGAGDAFSGAFLAAHIKGKSPAESLRWGAANGGSAVRFYGAKEGLLSEQEIEKIISSIQVEILE